MDCDGVGDSIKGGDNAAEGLQGGERMKRGFIGDESADLEERGRVED